MECVPFEKMLRLDAKFLGTGNQPYVNGVLDALRCPHDTIASR